MVGLTALRRAAWAAAALLAVVVALLVLAHTPPAASRVREWLIDEVAARWRLDLQATTLDYNALTRRVALADVRVAAQGHADEPFFTARRVTVTLPWAVFLGRVRLSSLVVEDGRVRLVRENGVLVNLPPSSGAPPPATPRRLDVRGLTVRNLDVEYVDRTGDIEVTVRGLETAFTERDVRIFAGASGTIGAQSLTARVGDHRTTSGRLDGRAAFDGSNVSLQAFTIPLREGTVVVDGRIDRALDDASFALDLHGTLDMAAASEWTPPPVPVSGAGTFDGTLAGPLGAYTLHTTFAVPRLRVARVEGLPLEGEATVTSDRAVVDRFTVTAPNPRADGRAGTIEGRFSYEFGEDGALALNAAWRDLDLDVALAAYDQDPLPISSWQSGEATLTRAGREAPLALQASGRSAALSRAGRIAIDGTWKATLENERWIAGHDHRVLDTVRVSGTARWPLTEPATAAPLDGPLDVGVGDVGGAVRAARRSGLALAAALEDVQGPMQGTLMLGGTLERPLVQGTLAASSLTLPSGTAAELSAQVVIDELATEVSSFALRGQGVQLDGDARVDTESGALSGRFGAEVGSVGEFVAPWVDDVEPFTGTARLTGTIGGTTDTPDVPWELTSSRLAYGEQPIGTVSANGRLLGTVVRVERFRLEQDAGDAEAAGEYDYVSGAYNASLQGRGLRIGRPLVGDMLDAVVVDARFDGRGTIAAPGGAGSLRLAPEGGRIADLVGVANVQWQFNGGLIDARVFAPKLRALADVHLDPRAPYAVRGTAAVAGLDVEPFALAGGAAPGAVTGAVGLSATFAGTLSDVSSLEAFVNLQEAALTAGGVPVRLERPARLTIRADDFSVDDLYVHVGGGLLTASGRLRDPIQAPLEIWFGGPVGDLATMARAFGVVTDLDASGELNVWWESTGGVDRASATATLTNGRIVWQDFPPLEALQLNGAYDGTMITVDSLRATWQDGGIEGKARLPRAVFFGGGGAAAPGRIDLTVRGLTHQALRPWLSEDVLEKLDARVSATVALDVASPSLAGLTGTVVLDEATLTAAGVPIRQERPAYLSFTRGVLSFDDVAFSAAEPVYIGGSVTFTGPSPALDIAITGSPGLRPFSVLMPNLSVDGVAKLNVYVSGTFEAPRVDGRIDLSEGELVMREPRVIASDVAGPVLFEGDRMVISGLTGSLNGGTLDASGAVTFSGVDILNGEIAFQARNVAIEYPDDVDTEIDALLVFTPGPGAPALRGDVRVLRGAYRGTVSLPALVAFNNAPAAPEEAGYLDGVRLDVSVSTDDPLVVDNNYGQFEATVDLRLQGTVGRPGVTGRAELLEGGEVFLLGGVYRLDQSSISFVNPTAIEPDLDITLTTRSAGAELTITLSGPLTRLETDVVSSDPNATDTSLVSVLLGGNSLGGEDALALLSGELLGATGRAIGLDTLRLERGFNEDVVRQDPGLIAEEGFDPSMRLTLSKRLRADVEVILSQDLRQSGGLSAVISYRPFRGVELRGTQRDDTDRTYVVRHEISFGGGRQTAAAPPRPRPEVAAVLFEGAGADEAALRDRLALEPGDRFDFVTWRDDVDRLTQWYHDRNHFEARVRASRADTEGGRIELIYRVTPGPETLFVVGGIEPSPRLAARLEDIWASSIFDRFLLEELQREVALDVVRADIVGATVQAEIREDTPARKVVAVDVRGGQAARRRELRFQGVEAFTRGALQDALRARGLHDYAWIDPTTVEEPLADLYEAAGYRAATVRSEPPRFEGDVAVLAVNIVEGPVTQVGEVRYEGIELPDREAIIRAAAIAEGQPFRRADVEEARRRLEAQFRQRGYNEVEVLPRTALDAATATAAVTFEVRPGPQQVLSEVVVGGTTRTRPGAVTRALGLKPGTPVDFTQWALARKRVFDTNVFRQVEVRPEELPASTPGVEPVRARVTVTEWPAWRVRYGLQLNDRSLSDQGDDSAGRRQDLGIVADVQNRNVFGRAFTLGVYGRAERRLQSGNAYLTFPTLFGRAVQTNVFALGSRQDLSFDDSPEAEYRRTRESVSIEQRIRRGRSFEVTYGYRLSHELIDAFDPEDPFLFDSVVGRFTSAAFIDRRDDPFNATRGWFTSFTAERVSNFESGDDSIKLLGAAYYYRPLGRVTLASAVRIGGSLLDPLGLEERFFVGGADTLRGYAENAAGPRGFTGQATGGDAQLILNQEVRAPIYGWLKGVVFVDAGNVFPSNRDISLGNLEFGYGVGVRLDTPFSLLRIDLGIPARGSGAKRWYFGIGQVF